MGVFLNPSCFLEEMVWFRLTVIDENERRVTTYRGPNWVFHTLSCDPRTIDAFIEAEMQTSDFSSIRIALPGEEIERLRKIMEGTTGISEETSMWAMELKFPQDESVAYLNQIIREKGEEPIDVRFGYALMSTSAIYPANSKEGTKRSPDIGGTLIADLRKREIIVKAYPAYDDRLTGVKMTKDGAVHPTTGEQCYDAYGFLSEMRSGEVSYFRLAGRGYKDEESFTNGRIVESDPQHPTKDNPKIFWLVHGRTEMGVLAAKYHTWTTKYELPPSWKIRDRIKNKEY